MRKILNEISERYEIVSRDETWYGGGDFVAFHDRFDAVRFLSDLLHMHDADRITILRRFLAEYVSGMSQALAQMNDHDVVQRFALGLMDGTFGIVRSVRVLGPVWIADPANVKPEYHSGDFEWETKPATPPESFGYEKPRIEPVDEEVPAAFKRALMAASESGTPFVEMNCDG